MSNTTKHGLAAGSRVFANENQQEFDELVARYHAEFAPTNIHERFLVDEIAQSRWRLARARRLEAALVGHMVEAAGSGDSDAVLANALLDNTSGPFKIIQGYAEAAERSGRRARKQLRMMREVKVLNAPNPAVRNEPNFHGQSLVKPNGTSNGYSALTIESPESFPERFPQGDC
jgi:hypothetical protein